MQMCQTNAELREFIQEFCAIMGEHFTGMADVQEKVSIDVVVKAKKKFFIQIMHQYT